MFVGRSEISISVIFKHNQNIGIARTFCPWGGGGGLLSCGLLEGRLVPRLTL